MQFEVSCELISLGMSTHTSHSAMSFDLFNPVNISRICSQTQISLRFNFKTTQAVFGLSMFSVGGCWKYFWRISSISFGVNIFLEGLLFPTVIETCTHVWDMYLFHTYKTSRLLISYCPSLSITILADVMIRKSYFCLTLKCCYHEVPISFKVLFVWTCLTIFIYLIWLCFTCNVRL